MAAGSSCSLTTVTLWGCCSQASSQKLPLPLLILPGPSHPPPGQLYQGQKNIYTHIFPCHWSTGWDLIDAGGREDHRHLCQEEALLKQQDTIWTFTNRKCNYSSFFSCQWEKYFPEFTHSLFTFVGTFVCYICRHWVCVYMLIHSVLHDQCKLLQFVLQIKTRLGTFPNLLNQNWGAAAILT